MLLYAKTNDELIPDDGISFDMNGNVITIKSLDLSGDFESIARQLNGIAKNRTIMRFGVQQALIVFICKTKSRSTLERDFYLIKARNPVPHGTGL